MKERRQSPRYKTSIAVVIYVDKASIVARAKNLSVGGMGLRLDTPLLEGSDVELSFHLLKDGVVDETTPRLAIQGTVMRVMQVKKDTFDCGIRFHAPNEEQRKLLADFLQRLA